MGDGEKLLTHLNSTLKVLLGLDIFPRVPKKKLNFVDQCNQLLKKSPVFCRTQIFKTISQDLLPGSCYEWRHRSSNPPTFFMIHFNNIIFSTYSVILRSKPYINSQLFHRPSITRDNYKTQGTANFPSQGKKKTEEEDFFCACYHHTPDIPRDTLNWSGWFQVFN